jgi:hypothetical protein
LQVFAARPIGLAPFGYGAPAAADLPPAAADLPPAAADLDRRFGLQPI